MSSITNPKLVFLNKLKQDQNVIGTFAVLKGVRNAQVLAHMGVDVIMIDCEHGHIGDSDMHDMVAAVSGAGVSPAIRVRSQSPTVIKRALDTGAHAILVPMINSASEARAVVNLAKFPPLGIRGQGSPFACFEHGLATPADYVAKANSTLILIAQIETAQGIENIEEICQIDGIDMVLIGPNDLALALLGRLPAKPTDIGYHEAINKVVVTARKYGKKTGMVVVDGATARAGKDKFDFIILSNEVRALQAWYKNELAVAKS